MLLRWSGVPFACSVVGEIMPFCRQQFLFLLCFCFVCLFCDHHHHHHHHHSSSSIIIIIIFLLLLLLFSLCLSSVCLCLSVCLSVCLCLSLSLSVCLSLPLSVSRSLSVLFWGGWGVGVRMRDGCISIPFRRCSWIQLTCLDNPSPEPGLSVAHALYLNLTIVLCYV